LNFGLNVPRHNVGGKRTLDSPDLLYKAKSFKRKLT
jgi:hypothetical protein